VITPHVFAWRPAVESRRNDMAVVTGQTLGYVRAPAAWSACQTLAAVRGVSMWRTPQGANASMTALATAAGAARVGNSPRPLTPSGGSGEGGSRGARVKAGIWSALGST